MAIAFLWLFAIVNLIDLATTVSVVYFIEVYYTNNYFPAFNIADSAITLGAGLLILDMLMESKRNKNLDIH